MALSREPVIVSDEAKIFAGIGHVCLQWALLEMGLLAIISAAENMPTDKTFLMFGGLDMLPRCNMAFNLAQHAKWPGHLSIRIKKIRTQLQRDGAGLAERRNQAVHGVHSASTLPEHVRLTMVRWGGPRRTQDVSIMDLHNLGVELGALAQEAFRIFDDYGRWKFGDHRPEDGNSQIPEGKPAIGFKIAQDIQARLRHFWRRLKGN